MLDLAWRNSHYGAVYEALNGSLESHTRNVAPGTEGVIHRALSHFRESGEAQAISKLESMAFAILRLQRSLQARADEDYHSSRLELVKLAKDWLENSPMLAQNAGPEARPTLQ